MKLMEGGIEAFGEGVEPLGCPCICSTGSATADQAGLEAGGCGCQCGCLYPESTYAQNFTANLYLAASYAI